MALTKAFASTVVKFEKSMAEIEKILSDHGIRESRYTHMRPQRAPKNLADKSDETVGAIVYEFVSAPNGKKGAGSTELNERRGVRIAVKYQPEFTEYKTPKGTTAEMGARALYWYLKAKFDSIDYGIEDFDVAFMPHLVTALGSTFAETPLLISEAVSHPESISTLALPAPRSQQ